MVMVLLSIPKRQLLHGLSRKAKFWRGTEDIEARVVRLLQWEVTCKPRLNYGSDHEVWAQL